MQKVSFSSHGDRCVCRGPSLTKACASMEAPRRRDPPGAIQLSEVPGT